MIFNSITYDVYDCAVYLPNIYSIAIICHCTNDTRGRLCKINLHTLNVYIVMLQMRYKCYIFEQICVLWMSHLKRCRHKRACRTVSNSGDEK